MSSTLRSSARALLGLLTLVPAATVPAVAQQGAAATATDGRIPLDSAVRHGTLPNGLRYYVRHNARPENRLELRLVVNAGSVLEDDDQKGLAHFVEHMLFNGTRRFEKNDIVQYLESIGVRFGADLNAYTSFDETVYILPVPTDKPGLVERSFDVLEDWASGALFDSAEVLKERGVVLEEWRSGLGADTRIRDKQFPVLFRGSRYAERLPIGDTTVLKAATPEPLKRFYRDWYRPDLMAVVAVGDYDPARVEALIRERFGRLPAVTNARPRPTIPVPAHDSTLLALATDPEQTISSIQVIYKHPPAPLSQLADYRTLLVRRLYNQMLNGRFNEIVRKPDAPFVNASSGYGAFVRTSDVYLLSAIVQDGGIEQGLEALLREAKRVDQFGFLPAELERAKASLLRGLETAYLQRDQSESYSFADEYVAHFLTQEPSPGITWEFETATRVLPSVTLDEVNALGRRWITPNNRVIAVSAPQKADVPVPSERDLLAAFRRVDGEVVTAWTETVTEAPLVATPPTPGRVVSERRIEELNLTDWRLSNGVRVLVKPTDFKADEVHLTSWSPGGLSLVPDEDFVAGALATAAADRGGLGDIPAIELGKRMAGKRASVAAGIYGVTEGVSGGGSPRDVELMLQLVYLRMTAPRRDPAAFEAFRAQVLPLLANRHSDPDAVFGDTVSLTMASYHPRARPLTTDVLSSVSYDRAFEIYRDRFADASDFTFLFVGNVNVDSLRPLVERWLGALPATNRREQWRDIGMRTPTGVVEKVVRKGVEPRATSIVFFTGDATYDPATRYALRSLTELLEIKLTETLREALGGTYSVSVGGSVSRTPREEYQVQIAFGSAPDKPDTLFRAIRDVIEKVKTEGVSEADVQKVREQQIRTQEVSLKENGYWLNNISARMQNGEDPRGLLTYEQDFIRKLTGEQIRDAARRFLNFERYARFVLLPERAVQ